MGGSPEKHKVHEAGALDSGLYNQPAGLRAEVCTDFDFSNA